MSYDPSTDPAMQALFETARREGLWFRSKYHGLWLTPDELVERHHKKELCWGPVNWELRSPTDALKEAANAKAATDARFADVLARVQEAMK